MNKLQQRLLHYLYVCFIFLGVIIILDFILPGDVHRTEIINVERNREQYYNAGGNYHYSYKVITNEGQVRVEKDFAKQQWRGNKIEYSLSIFFQEVNWYKLIPSPSKSYYSVRIVSGLILPFLSIFSILLVYVSKRKLDVLVFVLQVVLVANLIFVIM